MSFEPIFSYSERARRPRDRLDDDGVDNRDDVQRSQNGAAACHGPAQQDPAAPKQVQEQNGFRENERRVNRLSPPLRKLSFVDYPPII